MIVRLILGLLVIVSLFWSLVNYIFSNKTEVSMQELKIYMPFVFSKKLDPRAVYTVGDQVIAEHIFGYHYSTSIQRNVTPLFSDIKIDKNEKTIKIHLLRDVVDSNGFKLSFSKICDSVKSSFAGTQHTQYSKLVKEVTCESNTIEIKMSAIPVNLEYWLRSADFAIANVEELPIMSELLRPTTGPYYLSKLDNKEVRLKLNKFFPKELRANSVEEVLLKSYPPKDIDKLFDTKYKFDLAYVYGYGISKEFVEKIKSNNYKVQIFPNEWLVYLGFHSNVQFSQRNIIASKIDSIRHSISEKIVYGASSYSTVPSDRAFGLTEEEYKRNKPQVMMTKIEKKLRLATLDEWAKIPLFSYIIDELIKEFNFDVILFPRGEMSKVYSNEYADFYLSPMGISASDPLGNYSFLSSFINLFKEVVTEETFVRLYQEKDFFSFAKKVKELEGNLLEQRILIPIGHFPGIIIESERVKRDESRAWDWGIQAWTYSID